MGSILVSIRCWLNIVWPGMLILVCLKSSAAILGAGVFLKISLLYCLEASKLLGSSMVLPVIFLLANSMIR